MRIRLPPSLAYPITIRKIEKQTGEEIKPRDALFTYSYTTKVKQQERYSDEEVEVDKTFSSHYQSSIEGTITAWLVWQDDTITAPLDICDVEEPCKHSVQFGGMCAECGKDMTSINEQNKDVGPRATIRSAHDSTHLLISEDEAIEDDLESKTRLIAARKLQLVVDLDQTIIHAAVDPTIGEWQKDPENPNYDALKDVRAFQLLDDAGSRQECWYYIKLRPGLEQFLENIAEKYELHIYTMGTRQYAQQIAKIIDPAQKYFGDRIVSRDESGSMHAKDLARIFPVDQRAAVIIDDRADVWTWNPSLIRVLQFEFFAGIGDINAGYLPKKEDLRITDQLAHPPEPNGNRSSESSGHDQLVNGDASGSAAPKPDTSALQQIMAMSRPNDPAEAEALEKSQEEAIASQLEEKPLLKLQRQMDEKDGVETATAETANLQGTESDSSDSDTSSTSGKKRHSVLRTDDEELIHLERALRAVHDRFYAEYDRTRQTSSGKGGRVAALAGKQKAPLPADQLDLKNIPDMRQIMPAMKQRVLAGCVIVFSSVVPLKTDIQSADISMWARSFGAVISDKVTKETTHVVAARAGTAKVKQAVKKGIRVVSTDWLMKSIQQWKKLDERPYMLPGIGQRELPIKPNRDEAVPEPDVFTAPSFGTIRGEELSSEEDTSGLNDTDDNEDEQPRKKRPRLELQNLDLTARPADGEDGEDILSPSPADLSPEQWAAMDDELAEFMGSDVDSESDAESVRSDRGSHPIRNRKRPRDELDGDDSKASDTDRRNGNSYTPKRPKTSTLRTVKNAESTGSTTPKTGMEEQTQDDYDAELAAELERELEAADNP